MKKNKNKSKKAYLANIKEQTNMRIKQAYLQGSIDSNLCSIESFRAIYEQGLFGEAMNFTDVIMFLETTQKHLEEKFKNLHD